MVLNPSWVLRDPLASSLLVPGQILVWHPRCYLECVPFFDLTLWVSVSGPVLRRDTVSEWARVILVVKFLQCIVACVLQPSMFTQITVRLVSPFVEQVAAWEVGESDTTFLLFGLLGWFRQLLTRWWHWKRVVHFCLIYFLVECIKIYNARGTK